MNIGLRSGNTKKARWIVAYDTTTLEKVGVVEFMVHADKCFLNNLFVSPEFRSRGVATRLIRATLKEVKLPYRDLRWGLRPDANSTVKLIRAFDRKFARRYHEES